MADFADVQPGDDELITRGEHRRMVGILVERLERIESFCFEDLFAADGVTVERPSLAHFVERADRHISVLCDISAAVKRVLRGLAFLGAAGAGLAGVVQGWMAIRVFF